MSNGLMPRAVCWMPARSTPGHPQGASIGPVGIGQGGRITAASRPRRGSVFTFQLPQRAQGATRTQLGEAIAVDQEQDTP